MELHYGNISEEYLHFLDVDNVFTKSFKKYALVPYPNYLDSSDEIEKIITARNNAIQSKNWESIKNFCEQWDDDLIKAFSYWLKKMDIPTNEEYLEYLAKVSDEIGALIMQLKNHYNRARPFQVAYYTSQKLHPMETMSGNTPAYPSGHATQGYFLCSIIAHHYEEKKDEIMQLADRIAESRIIMGVHYPSDNEFGIQIAKDFVENEEVRKIYF
jgi:hypothetical protein